MSLHPTLERIFQDAGASAEDIIVLRGLAAIVLSETKDAIEAAVSTLHPPFQEVARVYFARHIEAGMLSLYQHFKTDDTPEA